jgi:hypothetical protein
MPRLHGDIGGPVRLVPVRSRRKVAVLQPGDRRHRRRVPRSRRAWCSSISDAQVLTDQLDDAGRWWRLVAGRRAPASRMRFGERPFTTVPMTWPQTEERVPINIGDADYDPSRRRGCARGVTRPAEARVGAASSSVQHACRRRRRGPAGPIRHRRATSTLTTTGAGLLGARRTVGPAPAVGQPAVGSGGVGHNLDALRDW